MSNSSVAINTQMRIQELTRPLATHDPDLEEGWRELAAAAGVAGSLALGSPADAHAPALGRSAPQHTELIQKAQTLIANPLAQQLKKVAQAAGLRGSELAQFMAQCAHETLDFSTLKELGGSKDFRKYDPKHAPRKAQALGNKQPGDGARYKGRGFIQLTGRDNYRRAGEALGLPLEQHPELAERPEVAAKVAVWFWKERVRPTVDNFADTRQVTKPINPGLKGLQDRHYKFQTFQVAMR